MIRPMHRGDVPSVTHLCDQLGYAVTAQELESRLAELDDDDDHLLLVADVGVVVGWVHAQVFRLITHPVGVEVSGLVISETARRLGTGSALMASVEEWAARKGSTQIRLRSNAKRRKVHKFYSALGYAELKRSKVFAKNLE